MKCEMRSEGVLIVTSSNVDSEKRIKKAGADRKIKEIKNKQW